jgi:3-hydroxy-9,10-secoandrosta-1,3,5(10)-triene-9,17-dione monooxygenase reductase component
VTGVTAATGDEWGLEPDGPAMRTVLGHFATGITVVTAIDGDEPVGMACNSFTSVSLEPPLVLFCAAKSSTTWPRIQRAGRWAANILGIGGEELCRTFAMKGADRFDGVRWAPGASGAPIIDGALAYVDCVTDAEHDAGDHVIVVGRVLRLGYTPGGSPLVFYRGGYGRFAP